MTPNSKTRVLFICIGNSCRSQMAEAFARRYGSDVIIAASAGLAPAYMVAGDTIRAMDDKNIDIRDHFPKSLKQLGRANFDLFVNMSGYDLPPEIETPVREWDVPDPIGEDFETHCKIRDEIETRVMGLILELRRGAGS
ncbi:MAG: low molecular weight phosphatase family protein [Bryobacteraceae bacterium]